MKINIYYYIASGLTQREHAGQIGLETQKKGTPLPERAPEGVWI